ncbi:MAG: DNA translocase FtsK 4TM domain-containing protein, partial [Pseudomonadota bacterium]
IALDWGRERAFGRVIFAPIAVALAAVYAATLNPPADWSHSFGMGGLFGDTVLLMVLQIVPGTAALGAKLISLITGLMILALGAFVLGFTWPEIYRLSRWLILGFVLIYAYAMKALGRGAKLGARASMQAAANYKAQRVARREQEAADEELWAQHMEGAEQAAVEERYRVAQVIRANLAAEQAKAPVVAAPVEAPVEEAKGLRAIMPSFGRREVPEPELVTPEPIMADVPETSEDRVLSKINKAIRARGRVEPPLTANAQTDSGASFIRAEPMLTREGAAPMADLAAEELVDEEPMDLSAFVPEAEVAPSIPVPEPKKVVQHVPKKPVRPSAKAMAEAQPTLKFDENRPEYEHPPLSLLMNPVEIERHHLSDEALEANARMLESVLDDYGVKGEIVSVRPGPVVTMYELEPAPGLKASRVIGLADDIARSMSALSARVSTVPGRSVIGIELPNENREKVVLREILSGRDFGDTNMRLPLALGKDIGGDPIVANLAKMPHLLIAGTTGSGKSVAINTMILSLLYKLTPEDCRLIMIDPKMLELSVYDGIPHLLSPVV